MLNSIKPKYACVCKGTVICDTGIREYIQTSPNRLLSFILEFLIIPALTKTQQFSFGTDGFLNRRSLMYIQNLNLYNKHVYFLLKS